MKINITLTIEADFEHIDPDLESFLRNVFMGAVD